MLSKFETIELTIWKGRLNEKNPKRKCQKWKHLGKNLRWHSQRNPKLYLVNNRFGLQNPIIWVQFELKIGILREKSPNFVIG